MATCLKLPAGFNGITEVGIAAGADDFSDLSFAYNAHYKRMTGAPALPTPDESRAYNLVRLWNALPDANARRAAFLDNDYVIGPNGLGTTRVGVLAHITNYPADENAAAALAVLDNGTVGAAVAAYDTWIALPLAERPFVEYDITASLCSMDLPNLDPKAAALYQGLAAVCHSNGYIIRDPAGTKGMLRYTDVDDTRAPVRTVADCDLVGYTPAQETANIITATKVTWYQGNHNVGQDINGCTGFVGKICGLQNLDTTEKMKRDVRNVIWAWSKIVTTRGILSALGVLGIRYNNSSNTGRDAGNDYAFEGVLTIVGSEDVKKRLNGPPAGVAHLTTYNGILKRAQNSLYAVCVPPMTTVDWHPVTKAMQGPLADALRAILADPCRYHMGSRFLTGLDRLVANTFTDEEKENLSAFIHAAYPNCSLAQAPVIVKKSEISGCATYSAIISAKTSLQDGMSDSMTSMLMSRLNGGATGGGIAVQTGKITPEAVAECRAMVDELAKGEVSDDEEESGTRGERAAAERRNVGRATRRITRAAALSAAGRSS